MVLLGLEEGPRDLDGPRDGGGDVESLTPQVDLAHGGSRDVEQIVHQAREVPYLALDHGTLAVGGRVGRP